MKYISFHLTKLVRVGAVQKGTPVWESRLETQREDPSAISCLRGSLQVTMPLAPLHSPHGILAFPDIDCCFYKMVTFIYCKHLCHNSDLLNGSWKKLFWVRTSYPQNCPSVPLPRVAWTVLVPEPPPAHLGDLAWAAEVSPVPTSKATFQPMKAPHMPCFHLWPKQCNCVLLQML